MAGKTKKATFNIHVNVLEELDDVLAQERTRSKNALVEEALIKELKELRKQKRKHLWQEAAKDALLIKDLQVTETAFRSADEETAQRIG
ncbi:MAG TPA: hypothetical protein VEH58_03280 [Dehalococcoidales bacterium]|nr:hypothetical protein [Dehalococcoidales bacterium]